MARSARPTSATRSSRGPPASATRCWGAFKLSGEILAQLHLLWLERGRQDAYVGSLVNAWLERGGDAHALRAGESYVDVGTIGGYHEALQLLRTQELARHVRDEAQAETGAGAAPHGERPSPVSAARSRSR